MSKLKVGKRVKYIGSGFPEYTGKEYRISSLLKNGGVSLSLSEYTRLEGYSETWSLTFLVRTNEIEKLEE